MLNPNMITYNIFQQYYEVKFQQHCYCLCCDASGNLNISDW